MNNVIVDTDPAGMIATGLDVDDDLAILVALSLHRQNRVNVLGITVCSGNTQLRYALPNARELRRIAGYTERDIPIRAGASWWPLPYTRHPQLNLTWEETDASRFIVRTVMDNPPDTVTVLCLGPLTNLATALQHAPSIASRIRQVIMMGGILRTNSKLDYNFRFDRTAAAYVLKHNIPKTMVPVETCAQAVFGPTTMQRVKRACAFYASGGSIRSVDAENADEIVERSRESTIGNAPAVCALQRRLSIQRRVMPIFVNPQYADIGPKSRDFEHGFILWDVVGLMAMVEPVFFSDWQCHRVALLPEVGDGAWTRKPPRMQADPTSLDCNVGRRSDCAAQPARDSHTSSIVDDDIRGSCSADSASTATTSDAIRQQPSASGAVGGCAEFVQPRDEAWSAGQCLTSGAVHEHIVRVPRTIRKHDEMLQMMLDHLLSPPSASTVSDEASELSYAASLGVLPHCLVAATTTLLMLAWLIVRIRRCSAMSRSSREQR